MPHLKCFNTVTAVLLLSTFKQNILRENPSTAPTNVNLHLRKYKRIWDNLTSYYAIIYEVFGFKHMLPNKFKCVSMCTIDKGARTLYCLLWSRLFFTPSWPLIIKIACLSLQRWTWIWRLCWRWLFKNSSPKITVTVKIICIVLLGLG
jgi:hypothetical protein